MAAVQPPHDVDPYAVLGVPPTASPDTIKQSFRHLALKHHPDRTAASVARQLAAPRGDTEDQACNAASFQLIVAAYSILKDPNARLLYDQTHRHTYHVHQPTTAPLDLDDTGLVVNETVHQPRTGLARASATYIHRIPPQPPPSAPLYYTASTAKHVHPKAYTPSPQPTAMHSMSQQERLQRESNVRSASQSPYRPPGSVFPRSTAVGGPLPSRRRARTLSDATLKGAAYNNVLDTRREVPAATASAAANTATAAARSRTTSNCSSSSSTVSSLTDAVWRVEYEGKIVDVPKVSVAAPKKRPE